MPEVTLEQVLNMREKRVLTQKKLLSLYDCPLISFTMNIAGPIKTTPLIKRAFMEGIKFLDEKLPSERVMHRSLNFDDCGFEAMYAVDMDENSLKVLTTGLEDETPLGRLFDMDIITLSGEKLGRNTPRRCLICEESAYVCASRRVHSVSQLQSATNKLICDYFRVSDRERFAGLASQSLLDEVSTTPKPGLVDKRNSGSHTDMTYDTFLKSIDSLAPYFCECIKIGQDNKSKTAENVFPLLRKAGLSAENKMFAATDGANTHKGIIYSLGILLGALGMLWTAENPIPPLDVLMDFASRMAKSTLESDFSAIGTSTAGGRLFLKHGILGIRGEAASGFPSVISLSLPAYKAALESGLNKNDAGLVALIHLIANVEDTNVYNRGGKEAAAFAKGYARDLLKSSPYPLKTHLEEMDDIFISKNLSPGGCADLLAITYFLDSISTFTD